MVQPHYKADESTGQLFKNIGQLGDMALRLTDNVIKQQADDTLTQGINQIRDSFGVAQAADLSTGIAPAVGAAGGEGTSLAPAQPAAGQPLAINRLGNRVDGLTESYKQGNLSNSAYYAKLEAFVRQTKQQFPGYGDQIDQMVSQKVGTTPANALRASLLQDVTQMQAKLSGQQTAQQRWEQQNAQYIYTQWPNYDQLKAEGKAPSFEEMQAVAGKFQARDYYWQSQGARLAVDKSNTQVTSDNATSLATERLSQIGAQLSVATTNSMGIKTPADLMQYITDVQTGKRPPPTPDEKQQISAAFAQLNAQYDLQAHQFLNTPLAQGSTKTFASVINDRSKIEGAIALGKQTLETMHQALIDQKTGILTSQVNYNTAVHEAAEGNLLTRAPVMADVAAARKVIGDAGLTQMTMASPPLMSAQLEGLRQVFQSYDALGKGTASDALTTAKNEGVNNANLNRAIFSDAKTKILQPEKFPKGAPEKSVQYLFGRGNETLIDRFQTSKDQVQFFSDMVSPRMAQSIQKLDKTSQQTYTKWATDAFSSVFETQVNQANKTASGFGTGKALGLDLKYNPDTHTFVYQGGFTTPRATVLSANHGLDGLNAAISSMKEVFKMEGVDTTAELMRLLPVSGIEPGSPIYKAIQDEFDKQVKDNIDKAQGK
jgi:hypothetical protein